MAFPQVASITQTSFTSNSTAHLVAMPATVAVDDLLISYFTNDGSATVTTPTGWTLKSSTAQGVACRHSVYVKKADGTEDGTTVDHVTSASEAGTAQVYRILAADWSGTLADVVVGTAVGGASTNPDSPSLTPAAGAQDYLWIASYGNDSSPTTSAYPTNYTNGTNTAGVSAGAGTGTARRELNTATEDPGTFTLSASEDWVAQTLAVPPAAGGGITGTGASTLAGVTSAGTGVYGSVTGTGASTLAGVTSAGSGTYTPAAITGTGASTLDGVTSAGTGVIAAPVWGHWDASVLGLSNGANVTSFTDQSGNGRHFVQFGADAVPTYATNSQNGLAGVDFASTQRLVLSSISLTAPRTWFLVAKNPTNTGAIKTIIIGTSTLMAKWSQADRWIFGHSSGSFIEFTDNAFVGVASLWTFVHKATGAFVRADQVQQVSGNITANTETGLSMSASSDAGSPMIIYELIVYEGELTSGEIDTVEDYLYDKWFVAGPITGTGASTLDGVTSAGSGTYTPAAITGTGASTLDGVTSAGSGTYAPSAITGTGSSTLGGVTSAGSGTFTPAGITGTGASTLDGVTSNGIGTFAPAGITGTGTSTLAGVASTGVGVYTSAAITGTGTSTLDGVSSTGSGVFTLPAITGTGSSTLTGVTSTGAGIFSSDADVDNVICGIEYPSAVCGVEAPLASCRIGT